MEVQPTHCSLEGGWWERPILMVKKLLRQVLGRASLSYEETISIICDCEATVNSTPLTYFRRLSRFITADACNVPTECPTGRSNRSGPFG
jgi:hypothetical protein